MWPGKSMAFQLYCAPFRICNLNEFAFVSVGFAKSMVASLMEWFYFLSALQFLNTALGWPLLAR